MRRRLQYWKTLFLRAVFAAGWVAGVVTVLVGGSVLAAGSFLLHERHRVLAVVVFAGGVVAALLEGSYRVWDATELKLQATRGRLRELDTAEAKRAFLDQCIAEARDFIREIGAQGLQWFMQNNRILEDVAYWETGVRGEIRKTWGPKQAQRFDHHPETDQPDTRSRQQGADEIREYMERRITRLAELRDETH